MFLYWARSIGYRKLSVIVKYDKSQCIETKHFPENQHLHHIRPDFLFTFASLLCLQMTTIIQIIKSSANPVLSFNSQTITHIIINSSCILWITYWILISLQRIACVTQFNHKKYSTILPTQNYNNQFHTFMYSMPETKIISLGIFPVEISKQLPWPKSSIHSNFRIH